MANTFGPGLAGWFGAEAARNAATGAQIQQLGGLLGIQNAIAEQQLTPLKLQELQMKVKRAELNNQLIQGMQGNAGATPGGQPLSSGQGAGPAISPQIMGMLASGDPGLMAVGKAMLEGQKPINVRPGGTVYVPGQGPQYTAPNTSGTQITYGPQGPTQTLIPGALATQSALKENTQPFEGGMMDVPVYLPGGDQVTVKLNPVQRVEYNRTGKLPPEIAASIPGYRPPQPIPQPAPQPGPQAIPQAVPAAPRPAEEVPGVVPSTFATLSNKWNMGLEGRFPPTGTVPTPATGYNETMDKPLALPVVGRTQTQTEGIAQEGQKAFATGFGKEQAGLAGKTLEGGDMGRRLNDLASAMNSAHSALRSAGGDVNKMAGITQNVTEYAQALGIDPSKLGLPKDAGPYQLMDSITNRFAMGMIGPGGMPANNFSEADREFLIATMSKKSDTPQGFANKLDIIKRVANRNIEAEQSWIEAEGKGKSYTTWRREWNNYVRDNPLYKQTSGNQVTDPQAIVDEMKRRGLIK